MKLVVALLSLCFAGLASAGARAETASPLLSITLHGDGARATQLPSYDPAVPIAVVVADDDGQHIDSLSVVAASPAGTSVKVPLVRSANGFFSGMLTLSDLGIWRLRLISRSGPLSTGTTPITLDVAAPPPSNASWVGWGVGFGIFAVVGVGGFFILRRLVRLPTSRVPAVRVRASGSPASGTPATDVPQASKPAERSAHPTAPV